ncbi:hypothetical protein GALL_358150 [mine drainage metagenome]|uniref:Uncharacterized protein n=1 Tax=mine drainage metagenome TaxID=410659 RepID=A0A1J5QFT8_9ZZZZ
MLNSSFVQLVGPRSLDTTRPPLPVRVEPDRSPRAGAPCEPEPGRVGEQPRSALRHWARGPDVPVDLGRHAAARGRLAGGPDWLCPYRGACAILPLAAGRTTVRTCPMCERRRRKVTVLGNLRAAAAMSTTCRAVVLPSPCSAWRPACRSTSEWGSAARADGRAWRLSHPVRGHQHAFRPATAARSTRTSLPGLKGRSRWACRRRSSDQAKSASHP